MTFFYQKLRARIIEKYGSQKAFALELGVTPTTISRKMQGRSQFSKQEICRWCKLLDISNDEIPSYFFALTF